MDAAHAGPDDDRGRCLRGLAAEALTVDGAWMRRALGAVYLTDLNAQAMLFIPARRVLQLATGGSGHPAALATWRELDAGALLGGGALAEALLTDIGTVPMPARRYVHGD